MKTIERYVFGSFLSSFLLAFIVLTFVMTIGLMVQIVGYILDGVPMSLVGDFAAVSFPETLQWTMPLALLVSSVLVFSRMSADSEISAMRSCGINLLTIMKWPVVFAIVCTLVGAWINNEIVPRGHEVRRSLKSKVSVETGLDVLEPGKVISDFPHVKIYFGSKEGNWLRDLVVLDYSDPKGVERMITASKALVTSDGRDVSLDLYQMTVDPVDADHPTMARANRFQYLVRNALQVSDYSKRDKDLRFREVLSTMKEKDARIRATAESMERDREHTKEKARLLEYLKRDRSNLSVEFSKRFVFALASLCFVLVGVPLGIRSHRKESTVGMAISLAISLCYYLVVMLMLGMQDYYSIYPQVIIYLAPALCGVVAAKLIRKNL